MKLPATIRQRLPSARVPIQYEDAVRSLTECQSIDDAKYWDDGADALAAWAKIHKDQRVMVEAKRLKLHAYRRMGELAGMLQPTIRPGRKGRRNTPSGPVALLMGVGMSRQQANQARAITRMPKEIFEKTVEQTKRLGITENVRLARELNKDPTSKRMISRALHQFNVGYAQVRSHWLRRDPKMIGVGIYPGEVKVIRAKLQEVIEWIDAVDQYLPKELDS